MVDITVSNTSPNGRGSGTLRWRTTAERDLRGFNVVTYDPQGRRSQVNAALIPWLTATAFLHSVIVQEKKGMLKVWNVSLVALTYVLCIVGTFLTRSGFTSSIHTFVVSSVGWWFIGYIGIVASVAIIVIVRNLDQLRSPHRIDSLVSREATFLFNNLLFVALAFAILWGVLFPSISEALAGHRVATQSPYYDFFAVVLGLPLLLLAGVGPVVAWRRASLRGVVQAFRWPFVSALAAGAALVVLGFASSVPGVVAISLCLFVAVTIGLELARGTSARRALTPGASWPAALAQLVGRNRRRYGGYVVHLAVVIGILAIVGTSAYATSRTLVLAPGKTAQFHGYGLRLRGIESPITRSYISTEAVIDVFQGGRRIDTLRPSARTYLDSGEPTKQIAIRPLLHTGEDLYLVFDGSPRPGVVTIKAFLNPLVNLLWLSAVVLVLGFAIAVWPDPRLAARLAKRTNEAFARAR